MIPLETKKYFKAIKPIMMVKKNNLFARAVIEQKVKGEIYVDNTESPQTFYVVHPYGMSLLFGESNNHLFNQKFKDYVLNVGGERTKDEWMQTYPNDWDIVLRNLFESSESVIDFETRVNFKFNKEKYYENRQPIDSGFQIYRTTGKDFNEMTGTVIPSKFWNDSNDFVTNSVGFSLYYDNELATIAFAAFIEDNALELGIETCAPYRGKHFAYRACSALIDYCIENSLNPLWACRLGNVESYKLAQKLGFEVLYKNPYYRLKLNY